MVNRKRDNTPSRKVGFSTFNIPLPRRPICVLIFVSDPATMYTEVVSADLLEIINFASKQMFQQSEAKLRADIEELRAEFKMLQASFEESERKREEFKRKYEESKRKYKESERESERKIEELFQRRFAARRVELKGDDHVGRQVDFDPKSDG